MRVSATMPKHFLSISKNAQVNKDNPSEIPQLDYHVVKPLSNLDPLNTFPKGYTPAVESEA